VSISNPSASAEVRVKGGNVCSDLDFDTVEEKVYWIKDGESLLRAKMDGSETETFMNRFGGITVILQAIILLKLNRKFGVTSSELLFPDHLCFFFYKNQ